MPSPNSTFTELVTTTLRNHPSEVVDNVSDHNALYRRLKEKGQIDMLSGGYEIVRPLDWPKMRPIRGCNLTSLLGELT